MLSMWRIRSDDGIGSMPHYFDGEDEINFF